MNLLSIFLNDHAFYIRILTFDKVLRDSLHNWPTTCVPLMNGNLY
jgi:hypothetical protein